MGEALQVAHEVAPGGSRHEPRRELLRIGRRQTLVTLLGGELHHCGRPQAAVEVIVEEHFRGTADLVEPGLGAQEITSRTTDVGRRGLVAYDDRLLERLARPVEALGLVGVKLQERLSLGHLVTRLDTAHDARRGAHSVLLACPPGPEAPRCDPDRPGVEPLDDAGAVGGHQFDVNRTGQRSVGITSLGHDHCPVALQGRAVPERNGGIGLDPCQLEHLSRERERELDEIGRVVAAREHFYGLGDLERVADRSTEGRVHRAQERPHLEPVVTAEANHRPGELGGPVPVGHESARADLHVQDERLGPLGDLLGHDRPGDERDRLHGPGHVAKCVELAIRRGKAGTGRADDAADLFELGEHLAVGQLGAPSGDRLQLVEGATGVAEPPSRQLRHRGSAGGHERRQYERHLVADATGRVLVDRGPRQAGEVHPLPGGDDRGCPPGQLGDREPTKEDRHQEGGDLLVRDRAGDVGIDDPVDLGAGELAAVPF